MGSPVSRSLGTPITLRMTRFGCALEKGREPTGDIDKAITEISTSSEDIHDKHVIKRESETNEGYSMYLSALVMAVKKVEANLRHRTIKILVLRANSWP